jgi:hypothetical protein
MKDVPITPVKVTEMGMRDAKCEMRISGMSNFFRKRDIVHTCSSEREYSPYERSISHPASNCSSWKLCHTIN